MRDEVPRILSGHFCLGCLSSAARPPRIGPLPPEMRLALRADKLFVLTLTISTMPKENFRGVLKVFSENFSSHSIFFNLALKNPFSFVILNLRTLTKEGIIMDSPQTINGLMRHLRDDCKIDINGSKQKKQLISYGYYHGYKGYRFIKNKSTQIPYSSFSEIIAVIEYDNTLKSALYPNLMFIETALKNIVCNESVKGLRLGTFDHIYKERMNDNPTNTRLQSNRLKLRNAVYSKLSKRYHDEESMENQMVRHFYSRGEDVPVWVIFEILYLSELASYFECLNETTRERILCELNMFDISIDTNRSLLSGMVYTLKSLRNAVAHNSIVFDTRFKDRKINTVLKKWIEKETNIQNITLYSLIDYIIIVCCLLKRIDFNTARAKRLLSEYKYQNQLLQNNVAPNIYSLIVHQNVTQKISALENYLNS